MAEGKGGKLVVKVDPDLAELIPGFIQNRHDDIRQLKIAVEKGDMATARLIGHSMKGSGGGYGFYGITDIGGAMEIAAKNGKKDEVERLIGELSDYLDNVEIVY
jgi:HPt (histidine-containing phosphotransfer) domain-containing protein